MNSAGLRAGSNSPAAGASPASNGSAANVTAPHSSSVDSSSTTSQDAGQCSPNVQQTQTSNEPPDQSRIDPVVAVCSTSSSVGNAGQVVTAAAPGGGKDGWQTGGTAAPAGQEVGQMTADTQTARSESDLQGSTLVLEGSAPPARNITCSSSTATAAPAEGDGACSSTADAATVPGQEECAEAEQQPGCSPEQGQGPLELQDQGQQLQQRKQQQPVHTPGLQFTLVTSVIGARDSAAASRQHLEAQLLQLEDQAAQLAPVDGIQTLRPNCKTACVAAGAADGVGGVIASSIAKVVTASKAKAAAKLLQPAAAAGSGASSRQLSKQQQQQQKHLLKHAGQPVAACSKSTAGTTRALPTTARPEIVNEAPVDRTLPPAAPTKVAENSGTAAGGPQSAAGCGVSGGSVAAAPGLGPAAWSPPPHLAAAAASMFAHADAAKIVDAATRAGPAHMQDIWA